MREFVKGGVLMVVVSLMVAFIHSCTVDNGILRPACLVSEVDLSEKWWYPQENPTEASLYFRANGLLNIEGQTDSVSFMLENCNKIRVSNLSANDQEIWMIKFINDSDLTIQHPSKGLIAYSRMR